ncbi:MAG: glycosyltransferase family 4 protein, partial [Patescibacteria group bacterium]
MTRKKIHLITPIFPPDIGGPASYVYEVGQRLKKQHDLSVLGFCEGQHVKMKNVDIHTLNPKKYSFWTRQLRLRRLLKKYAKKSDLLYIQGPVVVGANSLLFAAQHKIPTLLKFVGDIAWEEASRRGKTKLSLEEWHDENKPDLKSKLLKKVQKWSFKKADRVIVPSQFLKRILMKYYAVPEDKIVLIFNAFDGEQSRRREHPERAYKLMTAGRMVPHKNIDQIIEAVSQLPENYSLDIYGNGPERNKLENLVYEKGMAERIKFHGNVSQTRLHDEMRKHDLFILYSSYEGLPHVILEAFSMRIPVIASDIPGTDEVALQDRTGVLAAPNNPQRLKEAIQNLYLDRKKREYLSSEAIRLLKSEFSW